MLLIIKKNFKINLHISYKIRTKKLYRNVPLQSISIPTPDIPIDEFIDLVKSQTNKSFLVMEYQSIEQMLIDNQITIAPMYKPKNRYKNIHPFDHNILDVGNIPDLEYINASVINGYNGDEQFIATQGPMDESKIKL